MSVSAILSVAARKAAAEAKKVGAQAMVFVLFLMLAVGAVINFNSRGTGTEQTVAEGSSTPTTTGQPTQNPEPSSSASATGKPSSKPSASASAGANASASAVGAASSIIWETTPTSAATPTPSQSPFTASALKTIYSADPTVAGAIKAASVSSASAVQIFDVYDSVGSHARLEIDANSANPVRSAVFDFTIQGTKYFVYLNNQKISQTALADGTLAYTITGIAKLPFDGQGKVWDLTPFAGSAVELTFVMDSANSQVLKTVFAVTAPKK
jgi:RNA polymerase sigma-70 factor (ECF subfamily)